MKKNLILVLPFITSLAFADENQQANIWQKVNRHNQAQEQHLVEEPIAKNAISMPQRINITTALMMAINRHQWQLVEKILAEYQQYPNYEKALGLFAQAHLAKAKGDNEIAEDYFQQVLDLYPQFVRARLDLARTQFENKKNSSAKQNFSQIDTTSLPVAVTNNINAYLNALKIRDDWHGNMGIGLVHSRNLNQSSQDYRCFLRLPNGFCINDRKAPKALNATGLSYEIALGKRIELWDQHGIEMRGLWYGKNYKDHKDYNESTLSLSVGYNYQNANNSLSIAPTFEYVFDGNHALYRSFGGQAEWSHNITPNLNSNIELSYKKLDYIDNDYKNNEGNQFNFYSSLSYGITSNTLLFGGIDLGKSHTKQIVNSYKKYRARLGLQTQFNNGFNVALLGSLEKRRFDGYNGSLQAKRHDKKQTYSISLGNENWAIYDFKPSFTVEHIRNKSNVDWLYSYNKTNFYLKFVKRF
ncbi:TPR repeat-containing protein NMB0313 precursor [Phocoenobacter uteri]|uniref:TPR repeat-containing protein NMB0313 n=1 Tax=Phocoenobacter uteri TaxID=146806 RepID=A0A379CCG9_9PAST|nr:porin family protein [Phocoenobacter uteri]MDG6881397.1 hypothetical protein [Phocoenobacter uteri]SUB59425.1 TPR repeat-containing protein NMB0313 precursor [Phocoenobacter uteri]